MAPRTDVRQSMLWLACAAVFGFLISAVFSSGLRWERPVFLLPYVAIAGVFLLLYFRRISFSPKRFFGRW